MEEVVEGNNEGDSTAGELNNRSTISSEIRRRLGPLYDLGFILASRKWLEKIGPDPSLSSAMPMTGYTFVIPNKEATILSAPKKHFTVYKLAPGMGLRFPLHDFMEQVLRF